MEKFTETGEGFLGFSGAAVDVVVGSARDEGKSAGRVVPSGERLYPVEDVSNPANGFKRKVPGLKSDKILSLMISSVVRGSKEEIW